MLMVKWRILTLAAVLYGALSLPDVYAAPANGAIIVRGNKMYNEKTGERFIMKGLTYEYAVSDDLYAKYSKEAITKSLKGLDFNTLRVYNINPEESYKDFMTDMEKLGVYVLVAASPDNDPYFGKYRYAPIRKDLGPNGKVTSAKNGVKTSDVEETCYPSLLLEYGKKIAKNFAQYDNTLGIILANEIMQMDLTAGACVKQYGADLKSWMRVNAKNMRVLPLAYAAADSAYAAKGVTKPLIPEEYHVVKLQGLLCGDQMKDGMMTKSIDIYLINEYRWGNKATYEGTYGKFFQVVSGLPIVVGFGEYGAFGSEPRTWPMVPYLLQEPKKTMGFSNVFSGGVAYSFGEAKLDKGSKFPMFTGGSSAFDGQPSYVEQPDYGNLKAQFAKYQAYSDPAAWDGDGKCKWAPTVMETIDPSNTRATKNGWILDSCNDPSLKLADTDTWIAKTRDGMVCDDQGGRCDVPITSRLGTTQEDICGGAIDIESGGGLCETSSDCGVHGKCSQVDGVKQCNCQSCYTGITCDTKDPSCSAKLNSSKDAPKLIAVCVSSFLGIMSIVFVTLGVVAHKQKRAMDKHGDQVKLRVPGGGPGSVQVPTTL